MIHRYFAFVTPRWRKTVTILRQAAMKSADVPRPLLPAASGSWLKVKYTGAFSDLILSAQPAISLPSVLVGDALAIERQPTLAPPWRIELTEITGVRPVEASHFW